jgi:antitoxin HigA-1
MRAGSILLTSAPASGARSLIQAEILRNDFLRPMKISVYASAQAIKVPRSRINNIVLGRRGVTADTAFRLARYFGTWPDFWINLQARYELDAAERKLRRRIERKVRPRAA